MEDLSYLGFSKPRRILYKTTNWFMNIPSKFCGFFKNALTDQKAAHRFRRLNALCEPVFRLIGVDHDLSGLRGGVVIPDFFDILAVARLSAVYDHDTIEGGFFVTHSRKSHFNCHDCCSFYGKIDLLCAFTALL